MKRMRVILGVLMFVFTWPAFSWAQIDLWNTENYNLELEGRYWEPKLDSTVKIVDNNIGTDINLVNDLGFDEKKDFGEARLQIKLFSRNKFNLSYLPLKWDADKVLTRTIQFEGKTYTAGTRVQSELDLRLFKAGYELDFLAGKQGFLGLTFDVLVADTNIEIKAASLAIDEKYGKTLPIPMIGVSGRLNFVKWMGITGKVSGLPAGGYGYLLDAEGSLDINPVKYVGISGGYRFFKAKASYNDNKADYQLDGPFAAVKIRF
jgi:hypothetical protein